MNVFKSLFFHEAVSGHDYTETDDIIVDWACMAGCGNWACSLHANTKKNAQNVKSSCCQSGKKKWQEIRSLPQFLTLWTYMYMYLSLTFVCSRTLSLANFMLIVRGHIMITLFVHFHRVASAIDALFLWGPHLCFSFRKHKVTNSDVVWGWFVTCYWFYPISSLN